jgi:hypothetical protein
VTPLYPQKLAQASLTGGGRSGFFTGRYVPLTPHIEGSTLLQRFHCVGHAALFAVTER